MNVLIAIFVGGGLGSLSRYGISLLGKQWFDTSFPVGTLIANVLSCIVLALTVGFFLDKITSDSLKAFILIGFCGGFSTFSTFSFETFQLMKDGQFWMAALNVLISVFTCLLIMYVLVQRSKG